jgi:uncharacterized membrane protein YkvI
MRKNISKILVSGLLMSLVGLTVFAQATPSMPSEITDAINRIKLALQGLGFIVAVVFIILGGYKFMTAGGSAEAVESAKKHIMWAVVGLVIIGLAEVLANIACYIGTGNWSCATSTAPGP